MKKSGAGSRRNHFFTLQPSHVSPTTGVEYPESEAFIQSYHQEAEEKMIENSLRHVLSYLGEHTNETEEACVSMVRCFLMGHEKGTEIDSVSKAMLSNLKCKFGSDRLIACLSTDFVHGLESTVSQNGASGI